jgi:hypothetical protein
MARKPNYNFERSQREKNKNAKKAERLRLKTERAEARKAGNDPDEIATVDEGEAQPE